MKLFRKIILNCRKIIKIHLKSIFISIGENCLADNILSRYKLKSFSTPYSYGRTNIECIILHEQSHFDYLLDKRYLIKKNEKILNIKYSCFNNTYNSLSSDGFELTHHNVLEDNRARKTISRRYLRLLKLKHKDITMLYHHRLCDKTNEKMMVNDLKKLAEIYENRGNRVRIYVITQTIIKSPLKRGVVVENFNNIKIYRIASFQEWRGDDPSIFWAMCDDDLIQQVINKLKQKNYSK